MLHKHNVLRSASFWLDGVKSLDRREVPFVEGGQVAPTFEGVAATITVVADDAEVR